MCSMHNSRNFEGLAIKLSETDWCTILLYSFNIIRCLNRLNTMDKSWSCMNVYFTIFKTVSHVGILPCLSAFSSCLKFYPSAQQAVLKTQQQIHIASQTNWLITEAAYTHMWAHTHKTYTTRLFLLQQCIPTVPVSDHVYEHTHSLYCVDTGTAILSLCIAMKYCDQRNNKYRL
jgi:hypothetical protein